MEWSPLESIWTDRKVLTMRMREGGKEYEIKKNSNTPKGRYNRYFDKASVSRDTESKSANDTH